MATLFDTILTKHGQQMMLTKRNGESQEIRAFLQPVLKKETQSPLTATALGAVSKKRWLYLGSSHVDIAPGDRIQQDKLHLIVQEVRCVFLGENLLYHRAILHPAKEVSV